MKKFALAGNPNSGKTTLFNSLTGSTAHVGNWPGVTVDKREGFYKKSKHDIAIVDLPGIYSLSPYTPEEVISRNYILDEKPDCIINIVDATNLERNLYLTTQLLEIDVPIVVALNMMDEVKKRGDKIDIEKLQNELGVPVVGISALKEKNIPELMQKAVQASKEKRVATTILKGNKLMHLINDCKIALEGQNIDNPLFHSIKLVEQDELEVKQHKESVKMIQDFKDTYKNDVFGTDFEAVVADARYKYISKNYSQALERTINRQLTKSDRADKILTSRWLGIPIFALILFAIFHITFAEDFLYLHAVWGKVGALGNGEWVSLAGKPYEGLFGSFEGILSPGAIIKTFFETSFDLIVSKTGAAFESAKMNPALAGFLVDGILSGLFAVLSFLPQILLLFLFFSILEDSGYMARIAFILDRAFRKFGLSGRSFMPMIMGFGCSVPAMINTRTLKDEKERIATVRVIPFFSCGAKLPILAAIGGGVAEMVGLKNPDLITFGMYILGMVTALVTVLLMRNTTLKGKIPPFIMELPSYHLPQFKSLMAHLWDKTKHFVKKAFTIILVSTVLIWVITKFSWDWRFLEETESNQSILAGLGQLFMPIFTPLGFGSQLTKSGWVFVVAAVAGLIAKENVIATFGTLAATLAGSAIDVDGDGGAQAVQVMIQKTGIGVPGLIAFIAFNMLTIPCFAAVATAKAELPNKKSYRGTIIFWLLTSYTVSTAIYLIGTWWWTIFIIAALAILVLILIILQNKGIIDMSFDNIKDKLKIKKRK